MYEWTHDNEFCLLENGEEYFQQIFAAVDAAHDEIVLEVYIWREDEIGRALTDKLIAAARRGVRTKVTVDGYGSADFSAVYLREMTEAGISVNSYDQSRLLPILRNPFCRLHRKIIVVDKRVAFVGGLNVWALHLRRYGERSMQDYAVRVIGPVVDQIHAATARLSRKRRASPLRRLRRWRRRIRKDAAAIDGSRTRGHALFVTRDNQDHPTDIEEMYRMGMRGAKRRIVIANAYFLPGYRFLRELMKASRRGVEVTLILQGNPDIRILTFGTSMLHHYLFAAGIRVYNYCERPLHAKVAVIDDHWVTIGSSNLDPISLGLNLEGNLFVLDHELGAEVRSALDRLMEEDCTDVTTEVAPNSVLRRLLRLLLYYTTRRMPFLGRWLLWREQVTEALRPAESMFERRAQ